MPMPLPALSLRSVEQIKQHLEEIDTSSLFDILRTNYQDESSSTGVQDGVSLTAVQAVITFALVGTFIGSVLLLVYFKVRRTSEGGDNVRFTLPSIRMPSIRMPRFGRDRDNEAESPASPSSSAYSAPSRRVQRANHDERSDRLLDNDGLDSSSDHQDMRDRL